MKIQDHLLKGGNRLTGTRVIHDYHTSKTSGKFKGDLPDTIIIHYTAGRNALSSVKTLVHPNKKVSAHLVIGRDGKIYQLVAFNYIAWHAGKSAWKDRISLNRYSIGIELDNAGILKRIGAKYYAWFGKEYDPNQVFKDDIGQYWHQYTEKQLDVTFEVCDMLVQHYGIKEILGHYEISPVRKVDPGPAFPLDQLRARFFENLDDQA